MIRQHFFPINAYYQKGKGGREKVILQECQNSERQQGSVLHTTTYYVLFNSSILKTLEQFYSSKLVDT